jgi:hypothetical protein
VWRRRDHLDPLVVVNMLAISPDAGNAVLLVVLIMVFVCWTVWLALRVKNFWVMLAGIALMFAVIIYIAIHVRFPT